jgi:hypothetical protein
VKRPSSSGGASSLNAKDLNSRSVVLAAIVPSVPGGVLAEVSAVGFGAPPTGVICGTLPGACVQSSGDGREVAVAVLVPQLVREARAGLHLLQLDLRLLQRVELQERVNVGR